MLLEENNTVTMAEPMMQPNVFDRLLRDRIIWLGSEVRDDNANEIAAKLLLLAAEDPEKDILNVDTDEETNAIASNNYEDEDIGVDDDEDDGGQQEQMSNYEKDSLSDDDGGS